MNNTDVLKFPIIQFDTDSIRRIRSRGRLIHGTSKSFRKFQANPQAFIIDARMNEFPILEVVPTRRSWSPSYWFGPVKVYVLTVKLGAPRQLSFEDAKRKVIERVVSHGWYSQGYQSEAKFRAEFEACDTWDELVEHLSFYGKWQV